MTRRHARVLDRRTLNRALLARQLLLQRSPLAPLAALDHLVGVQAQAPVPPYHALWSRLAAFSPEVLSDLIETAQAVRIALMRSTIHLVSAADCVTLRPLLQPVIERSLASAYGRELDGVDRAEAVAVAGELLAAQPLTTGEIGTRLAGRWARASPAALGGAVRAWLPLVQLPPRGLWGRNGPAVHAPAEAWLGRALGSPGVPELETLVERYLLAFGPASVADVQAWSGLTRLREVVERMRPRLRTFRSEHGAEVFDVPDAPLPAADSPAPVRFLAEFDNALLSHADRSRIIADEHRKRYITTRNGMVPGTVIDDGFVRAIWRIRNERGTATLTIHPFARWPTSERDGVREEGARLLTFAAPGARHVIRFAAPAR